EESGGLIMKKDAREDFKQNVWDYTILLDRYLEVETTSRQLPANLKSDDLTDWIMTFEGDIDAKDVHAVERWQQTKSLPWLVAAMAGVNTKQSALNELLSAAAKVAHTAPAYPTIAFHTVRLLKQTNRPEEARTMLDKILANERQQLTGSAVNEFLGERMMLARNLDEFLQNAPRVPAGFSDNYDGREIPDEDKDAGRNANGAKKFFAMDAANIFNK